jgi:acyl-CoA synthetase (AMP-forming)/AMP-acid ligase II
MASTSIRQSIDAAPESPWNSTADLVRARGALGSHDAIVDGDTRLTYADLAAAVDQAARAFVASGVGFGDRVAIWAPNIHEWIVASLGVHAVGGVLVPLNTRFRGAEATEILARSQARMLLTVRGFLGFDYPEALREIGGREGRAGGIGGLPDLREVVVFRGDAGPDTRWSAFLARADAAGAEAWTPPDVRPGDVSDIMFTSGTTGRPKGAVLRHGQMLRAVATVKDLIPLGESDRYLIIPPFFHTFGYRYGFILSIFAGATSVLMETLQVSDLLRLIERERISFLPGPPTVFHGLIEAPDRSEFDLSSLRKTLLGATMVPVQLVRQLRKELQLHTIITAYGMTETTGVGAICRSDDDDETVATTSGRPFPGTELKVAREDGGEARPGESGEVWIRGFTVMGGYLDDPENTAAATTPDGWYRTGDIGVKDERGNLRIVDRMKDMIIVGGFNAYPAEIEGLMLRNEKIAQVAVVGAPDARLGEAPAAFVQLRPGCTATAEEIITWCRSNMANFKAPRFVAFCETFPMNASGKVLKFVLRDRARELAAKAQAAPSPQSQIQ